MSGKRYYWLKLNENFFDRDEIKIIENMGNGKDYIIFYLKLLLKSVKTEGKLKFRDVIPYTPEMLSSITNTDVDTVRVATDMFVKLGLMDKWDDGTLFMMETQNMIGSETEWAKKKREYRKNVLEKEDIVLELSEPCRDVVRQEIDIDIDIDKDIYNIPYAEIITYLNEQANTNYKLTTRKTKDLIKARWNEGFRLEDFKKVIEKKCREWLGTEHAKYLRPETLFGTKFEGYLNQKEIQKKPNNKFHNFKQEIKYTPEQLERMLRSKK